MFVVSIMATLCLRTWSCGTVAICRALTHYLWNQVHTETLETSVSTFWPSLIHSSSPTLPPATPTHIKSKAIPHHPGQQQLHSVSRKRLFCYWKIPSWKSEFQSHFPLPFSYYFHCFLPNFRPPFTQDYTIDNSPSGHLNRRGCAGSRHHCISHKRNSETSLFRSPSLWMFTHRKVSMVSQGTYRWQRSIW